MHGRVGATDHPAFLSDGGETGALIRAHDWSATPLGPPETWPSALKTAVGLMLGAAQPVYVAWGPELISLYNDGYLPIVGAKHPDGLGQPYAELWAEIWDEFRPIVEATMSGEAQHFVNRPIPLAGRLGLPVGYFTFSYTALRDDDGSPAGFYCAATETTQQVLAEHRTRTEQERLVRMFEQAPGFIAMLEGPEHRFTLTNAAYRRLIGGRHVVGQTIHEALPEVEGQGFFDLLDRVYATGQPFRGSGSIVRLARGAGQADEDRIVDFIYQPITDSNGQVTGIFVEGSDVTEAHTVQRALAESEARYRQIVEGAEDFAIVTLDERGLITGWNSGAERITGHAEDEIIGQPGAILFTPEDRARDVPDYEMNRAKDEGRASDERWHLRKDGSCFWGSGLMMRMDEPGGGFLKIFRDRTAEHEAEARYRTLFETIDAGFCVVEVIFEGERAVDNRFLEVNPAFERLTGLKSAVGHTIREMIPDIQTKWFEIYGRVARTGQAERFEFGSDDLGQWFDVHALRIGKPEERRLGVFFNDVTERRRTEERLRDLNATLGARVTEAIAERRVLADIVETTNASVLACNLEYRILAINKANAIEFERVWGKRPRVGDNLLALLADLPEHQAQVARNWDRVLAGEEFMIVEEFGDPAHERVTFEVRFNVLRDREGHQVGAYTTAYDVTDRVRAQAELEAAQEALRQAQKMEAVGQLTGGVAHDFNNLLTIIRSSTGLLRRPDLSDERRRVYMDAISDTVDRAAKLTGQLLAFARRQALKPEVFDASARVEALSDMLGTILGGRIRVVTEVGSEPCFVKADVGQFETALVNMAVNARDAMGGEGTLTVRVECKASGGRRGRVGPFVALSLTDTGSGMPPETVDRIFEPFFTTKEVGKGTGLGLSQVYGFTKQSGGDVTVSSQVGRGTTFTLYLPQATPEPAEDTSKTPEPAPAEQGHGRRVLVVEDNIEVGTFSTRLLRDLGYETTWAVNAEEALGRLAEADGRFDVVFSDVVMPGMNGVELGEEIRRRFPDLPVILTSGYSDVLADEGRHGFELLQKPYAVEDLSRVLRRVSPGRNT